MAPIARSSASSPSNVGGQPQVKSALKSVVDERVDTSTEHASYLRDDFLETSKIMKKIVDYQGKAEGAGREDRAEAAMRVYFLCLCIEKSAWKHLEGPPPAPSQKDTKTPRSDFRSSMDRTKQTFLERGVIKNSSVKQWAESWISNMPDFQKLGELMVASSDTPMKTKLPPGTEVQADGTQWPLVVPKRFNPEAAAQENKDHWDEVDKICRVLRIGVDVADNIYKKNSPGGARNEPSIASQASNLSGEEQSALQRFYA